MTPSEKTTIVSRVKWIHANRKKEKELQLEKGIIQNKIQEVASETLEKIYLLKKDMKNVNELNVKIDDKYYTLTQKADGVTITEFFIQIH